jgi:hypothetical protein
MGIATMPGAAKIFRHPPGWRTGRLGSVLMVIVATGIFPSLLRADPAPTIFVGGQEDFSRYGYVGASIPVAHAVGMRVAGFGGAYEYSGGPSGRVRGKFVGGEAEALYQFFDNDTWLNVAGGLSFIDTHLSPADPGNRRHGEQAEPVVGLDGGHVIGPWRIDGYSSFGIRLDDYSLRTSLTHSIGSIWRAGLETSADGDPTYREFRIGPLAAVQIDSNTELQSATGVTRQSGRGTSYFLRLGLSRSF